jgi:hypothetical protein
MFPVLFLQLVTAQIPSQCSTCSTVMSQVATCKQPARPATKDEWIKTSSAIANCVCPKLLSADGKTCQSCLAQAAPTAAGSLSYSKLFNACDSKTDRSLAPKMIREELGASSANKLTGLAMLSVLFLL